MSDKPSVACAECDLEAVDRRSFLHSLGGRIAVAMAATSFVGKAVVASEAAPERPHPAEELIKELFSGLKKLQKESLALPFNHGGDKGRFTRLGMYNAPIANKRIGQYYTPAQRELIDRILKAVSSGDEGYRCISRDGTFDTDDGIKECGALFFGEPTDKDWAWLFTGHHMTVRCHGRSDDGMGFGGPMFYGHSPDGYSKENVFFYQTKSVLGLHDALSAKQRKQAVIGGTPGEGQASVKFHKRDSERSGLPFGELSRDQKGLVEKVMRDILSPYRKEDADEVMEIVKTNGGMDKIHVAFYQDANVNDDNKWHFWRLEGPGFIWNFRVLPHVHAYVNVAREG